LLNVVVKRELQKITYVGIVGQYDMDLFVFTTQTTRDCSLYTVQLAPKIYVLPVAVYQKK